MERDPQIQTSSESPGSDVPIDLEPFLQIELKSHSQELDLKSELGPACKGKEGYPSLNKIKKYVVRKRYYYCSECNYSVTDSKSLYFHIQLSHKNLSKPENYVNLKERYYYCPECNYRVNDSKSLKIHFQLGHRKMSKFETNLMDDLLPHFKCPKCSYITTKSQLHLDGHIVIMHSIEKPYTCHLCEYRAREQTHLRDHLMIHSGEKPHPCPHCDYRSNKKSNLKKHITLHTRGPNVTFRAA